MELLLKYLCFAFFLQAAFCELGDDMGDDMGDDIRLDIFSSRLDYISVILARIARKQKVIEARLNDKTGDRNEQQKNLETNSDFTKRWLEDELAVMKKAISSEKEFVRNLIDSLEVKIETKSAIQATSNGIESRVEPLQKKTVNLTISSDLQSRMESIEKNLDSIETISNGLGDRIESVEKKLDSVETTSDGIKSRMHHVETNVESIEKNLDSMETTSDGLEDRIESVEKKLDSVETTSNGIESRVHFVESSVSSLILASDRKVSFSAQYRPPAGSDAGIFKKQRVVPFNHVFYNEGSGFNGTTGIFTVPVSGVYQFIFFVDGWQQEDVYKSCPAAIVVLYVDRSLAEAAAFAEPRHKHQHVQAGNAYINYLRKGQEVLVATASTCDEYIIFGYRTTFNGVLLY